jgi:hypothetical protein
MSTDGGQACARRLDICWIAVEVTADRSMQGFLVKYTSRRSFKEFNKFGPTFVILLALN